MRLDSELGMYGWCRRNEKVNKRSTHETTGNREVTWSLFIYIHTFIYIIYAVIKASSEIKYFLPLLSRDVLTANKMQCYSAETCIKRLRCRTHRFMNIATINTNIVIIISLRD